MAYGNGDREYSPLPEPRLPRATAQGRAADAQALGASAVAGAVNGFITDMPFATQAPARARAPNVPSVLDEIEKCLSDVRARVDVMGHAVMGGNPKVNGEHGKDRDGTILGRLVEARGSLGCIMGDLSAIEAALGLREG